MAEQNACDITIYCKGNIGATRLGDCPFTQKALFCLSLHGLKFERKFIDLSNKPQSFLDLNKVNDDSFKLIYGTDKDGKDAEWKASCPVLEDRKNKVRIFDSGKICDFLEENYKPAVLAKNPEQEVPGGDAFFKLIGVVKKIKENNGGLQDTEELINKYKESLTKIDGYLGELKGDAVYLNKTKDISLRDIQLIPMLHASAIQSQQFLNINITNDKSEYKNLSKYLNFVYKQQFFIDNNYLNEDGFAIWRDKFKVKDAANVEEEEKKEAAHDNTGFYKIPDTPEMLYDYLCAAMSLELSTLPLYVTALYSFLPEDKLSETAKAAKKLVREIAMEEMLHMNLLNNVIASIYGVSKVTTKFNIPYGKGCKLPANIRNDVTDVSLKPYSKEQLYNAFIQIEAPTSLVKEHQPVDNDGIVTYPFEPKKGENSVDLTFKTIDDVNQIGEFYNAIMKALDNLSAKKLIEFKADDKEHKQRQCKSKKKETDDVTSVEDAKDAIELICVQGEGYQLKAGVFGAVAKSDGDENMANDVGTSEKTHFIKFIECLVGREVLKLEVVKEDKGTSTYRFTYGEGSKYAVDFEKEVYPMSNFEKAADDDMFNKYYKDMLEKLTEGLKVGEIGDSVKAMHGLRDRFKECMDKCVYPTFEVKDFPLPPSVVSDK